MKFIEGTNRDQTCLFPVSLEESVAQDNDVRAIDLFVESLPLKEIGFRMDFIENGRPAYHPKDLLKLFIYGYLNKTRSSRDLEKECKRNIEVMWLLKGLQPDHNTISNFRRDNPKAIKKVFRVTVQIAKNHALIWGVLIAGDSTKLRAQNSKKNNYNEKKIERHVEYIVNKLDTFMDALATADGDERTKLDQEIDKQIKRLQKYEEIEEHLKQSGETQKSTSDPESRHMIIRNNITEVAYNVQTTVDAEHCLILDYKVTNQNDSKAMGEMEHPYGTIKRQWGFSYIMTKKTMNRASADVGLILTAYNFRRIINILGFRGLLTALLTMCSYLFAQFSLIRSRNRHVGVLKFPIQIFSSPEIYSAKLAYI